MDEMITIPRAMLEDLVGADAKVNRWSGMRGYIVNRWDMWECGYCEGVFNRDTNDCDHTQDCPVRLAQEALASQTETDDMIEFLDSIRPRITQYSHTHNPDLPEVWDITWPYGGTIKIIISDGWWDVRGAGLHRTGQAIDRRGAIGKCKRVMQEALQQQETS